MIMIVISVGGVSTSQCAHPKREAEFQCYGVGNSCYYSIYGSEPTTQWIMFIPQAYKITKTSFYTCWFKVITNRYFSLVSQFNIQSLQVPFVKVIRTSCGESFGAPVASNAPIASVTKNCK
jgi:hypothetical protein